VRGDVQAQALIKANGCGVLEVQPLREAVMVTFDDAGMIANPGSIT